MKSITLCTLVLALTTAAATASAQLSSPEGITIAPVSADLVPVLVRVNKHGQVTSVSAPIRLKASWSRLLRENISEMVTAPAMKDGKGVDSQVIFMVALQTSERVDGDYDASFTAREIRPAPSGSFSWKVQDGRYSLVDYNNIRQARRLDLPSTPPPMPRFDHAPASSSTPASAAPRT